MNKGMLSALGAYLLWGFLPIFFKQLKHVPALEILSHRIVWSFILLFLILMFRKELPKFLKKLKNPKILLIFLASSCLIATNWIVYIWAVTNGHIVDASLGYFINPLINVVLGMIFLKERLRRGQAIAIVIAALGVAYLALSYGVILWIGLTLAFSFGFYALLRKTAPLGSLHGLSLEMIYLIAFGLGYLLYLENTNIGLFGHIDLTTTLLLICTGFFTIGPLLLFAYGAQRITMTTLGILQYTAPTLQFLVGVLLYGELLTPARMIGFSIIWSALALYTLESVIHTRARTRELALN